MRMLRLSRKRLYMPAMLTLLSLLCIYLFPIEARMPSYIQPSRTSGLNAKDKEKFAQNAINNTVIIVPSNTGMLHWVENLLCSLQSTDFNTSTLIFWALDLQAQHYLEARNRTTYHDPTLFAPSANQNSHGDTAAYKRMMRERPKFYIKILSAGFDILMLDADTVFWQSPLTILPSANSASADVDIIYSTDAREFYRDHNSFQDERRRGPYMPPVCNGIFWMRSDARTVGLWARMLRTWAWPWFLQPRGFQDDQRAMDVLLNGGSARVVEPLPDGMESGIVPDTALSRSSLGLRVRLLDQTQVVNGHLLLNRRDTYEKNLLRLRASGRDRIAAHFNWWTEELSKEEGAKQLDLFWLDDDGKCKTP